MTTQSQYQKDRAAFEASEQREKNLALFRKWLTEKHPEIKLNTAVENLFRDYMDFDGDSLTVEDFEFALGNLESMIYGREHIPTPEETKATLITKIVELTSKDGVSRGTTFKLAVSGGRTLQWSVPLLATWTVPQLTELLDEIVRKRTLVTQSSSELQQIVESARPNYGYPTLPKQIVRPGTVRAVDLNAEFIRRSNVYDLKKLIRLYGGQQVNARLAGKD